MASTKENLKHEGINIGGDLKVYGDFIAPGAKKEVTFSGGRHYHGVPPTAQATTTEGPNLLSDDELRERINQVMNLITNKRHWFCIAKVMMLHGQARNKDFEGVAKRINSLYPAGLEHEIDPADLQRIHTGSLTLPVSEWTLQDSHLKRDAEFRQYLTLAQRFEELLK